MKIIAHAESKGGKWGIELQEDKGYSVRYFKNGVPQGAAHFTDINQADRHYFYCIGLSLIVDDITHIRKSPAEPLSRGNGI